MSYAAPVTEMRFVVEELAGLDDLELATAILNEAARFAETVLAPLNQPADRSGSRLENGVVRTPAGFRDAYRQYVAAGWNGLAAPAEHGGQGLPAALAVPVAEMWSAAAMSFALCPLLNWGALELLEAHGSPEQRAIYLDKMVSGSWTGTMNLTEPQAGSDLGALRTRAAPAADIAGGEFYRITGQKIFITYGDHDLAENIVHMVLARTPDSPPGSRGISLFIVPKFLPRDDGSPGERNAVRTLRLEEKLGIHASPTCVLAYEGALGWRVGEENRGLECMFTMMNSARLHVGLQGVAIAERAYQQARDYARERVQGHPLGAPSDKGALPIMHHPDVRRLLLSMRAATEAMRALAYYAAAMIDRARADPDAERQAASRRVDLLIPIVKAWCTDLAVRVASMGVQVHGGMGYIEETGAAQYLRDARILPIYEGTNGIQAQDLVGRKLARDGGEAVRALVADMSETSSAAMGSPDPVLADIGRTLATAVATLENATGHILHSDPVHAAAGSRPYLELFGTALGGWLLLRLALAAERRLAAKDGNHAFLEAKVATARVYAEHFLALAPGHLAAVEGAGVMDFPLAQL